MEVKSLNLLYFSPTFGVKKVASAAAKRISELSGLAINEINFTLPENRKKIYEFGAEDLLIVASPTYAGKLPNKILPDFQNCIKGCGPAIAITCFGNRNYDNSLAELVFTLENNGFKVLTGAACVCRHAFNNNIGDCRPNSEDLTEIANFAENSYQKLLESNANTANIKVKGDAVAPYYTPLGLDGQPAKFLKATPKTYLNKCTNCGACVRMCPVASIDPANVANNVGPCIKCQACVRRCTRGAKYFDDPAFLSHVAYLEQNFTEPKQNEFFI